MTADKITCRVSGKGLREMFHACTDDYIRDTCRGRCCEGSRKGEINVVVADFERKHIEAQLQSLKVKGSMDANRPGYIAADDRGLCPFKSDDGFCMLHFIGKPLGCASSPFTVSSRGMIIVRNRNRRLRCYKCVGARPAYEAHRFALNTIFGETEAQRIADLAKAGEDVIHALISKTIFDALCENHATRNESKVRV